MKVQVTQTFVFVTSIEVPDDVAADRDKLRDYWVANQPLLKDVNELDWVGTDFTGEGGEELGDIG
jgi:hypothetical protein